MHINKKSPIPLYFQIKNYILNEIESGHWSKNNPIPSERELCDMAKVSRMTVRHAINELVNEGFLYRLKGKGTYITHSKIEQKNIMSFSDMVRNKGEMPITEILFFEKEKRLPEIALKLDLEPESLFYHMKRLRRATDVPVAIEECYIPKAYCPNLERHDLSKSLYTLLLEEYNYSISQLDVKIEAVLIHNEQELELLKIAKHLPILKIYGTSITDTGLPLFYETSFYRSDQISYRVNIFNRE